MAAPTLSSVIRTVLTSNPSITTDEAVAEVKRRGVKESDDRIRTNVYQVRKELKRAGTAMPSAARQTPKPAKPASAPKPTPEPAPVTIDLSAFLSNVSLVNRVVGTAGGIENARQVAEAVRSCGGVDLFLQHLDTVAGIRAAE